MLFRGTNGYDALRNATELFIASQVAVVERCCDVPAAGTILLTDSRDLAPSTTVAAPDRGRGYGPLANAIGCYEIDRIERAFEADIGEQIEAITERIFDAPGGDGPCCKDGERTVAAAGVADERVGRLLTVMQRYRRDLPLLGGGTPGMTGLLTSRLRCPPILELIWSYWMEQGMLVQGVNAVALRFQNRRFPGPNTLTRLDVSPLWPLNNVMWGYVQREPDRLSLARRAYEYDHHYGLRLTGAAVPRMDVTDSRSQFIEAFHRLLQEASRFHRLTMDTTMRADAFPVLNCLRELHLLLAEGAYNQFGDLPTTARAEMLIQQWLLARPELALFLGGRPGMPYPEAWMPQMDTLRQMMNWNDASIRHYRDLATFGEQLLLSVRYVPWSDVNDAAIAEGWLTTWRAEIQSYIHSYRAVTGVDLSAVETPVIRGGLLAAQPSDLIGRRRVAARAV
jgi:hypothetical protein